MRTSDPGGHAARFVALAVLLAALAVPAASGRAQVCGDADGDGLVTDVDAANALLGAAELPSLCTPASCDVNANGGVDDTDGVLLLRTAAGLAATLTCVPTGGTVDSRVLLLVRHTQGLLSHAFELLPQGGQFPTPGTISCDNGFDDGEITIDLFDDDVSIAYDFCELDDMILDGTVDNTVDDGLIVDVTVVSTINDDEINFAGESFLVTDTGTGLRISGTLDAVPTFETASLEDAVDFTLQLQSLLVAPDSGVLLSGSARLDLGDAEISGLEEVQITYTGSNVAQVSITPTNGTPTLHLYNIDTRNFL